MQLDYTTISFTATLDRNLPDPFLLFACRARFDAAFRRVCGCTRGDCAGCRDLHGCPYPANFAQELSCDPETVRRHQKPPLPFVFGFPPLPDSPNRGSRIECTLTLFGSAIQHLSRYLAAIRTLFEEIGASLDAVGAVSAGGETIPVTGDATADLPIRNAFDLNDPLPPDRLTLEFSTPLRIVQEGRVLRHLQFHHVARSLMRRASALAGYYGGGELPLDYRWLSGRAAAIETAASSLRFVEWGRRVSGVVGTVTFTGELHPFHELLQLGEVTHLGKGASFGEGAYRLLR